MNKFSLLLIRLVVGVLDLLYFQKKSGWLFHGYNGQPIGNNFALARYISEQDPVIGGLYWTGVTFRPEQLDKLTFRPTPQRHAPLAQHISFMFFLMRFKIISVEGAGDLIFYMRFLPRRGRLIVLLPHGFNLKSSGVLASNLNIDQKNIWGSMGKRFHLISAASRLESYMISATFRCPIENVPIVGYQRAFASKPYTDSENREANELIRSIYGTCPGAETVIVYAPTHRDHLKVSNIPVLFGFPDYTILNETLSSQNCRLIIRSHALATHQENIDFTHICDASKKPSVDFNLLAPATDILITDYSGIFIEFLKSDIKLAFWHYDLQDYREARGFSMPEDIFRVGANINGPDDFQALLSSECNNGEMLHARRQWASILCENTQTEALEKTMYEVYRRLGIRH